jgi:hypothetical protein
MQPQGTTASHTVQAAGRQPHLDCLCSFQLSCARLLPCRRQLALHLIKQWALGSIEFLQT